MPSHGWIFPSFYYLNFIKFTFLDFHVVAATSEETEDLSIDVSTTNVGLILTKLRWFQRIKPVVENRLCQTVKKKLRQRFGKTCFPYHVQRWVLSSGNKGKHVFLKSLKKNLRRFQLVSTSQNWIRTFLKKKFKFSGFHYVGRVASTHEDLSIDASISNVGLILTKLWWFLF